MLSPDPVTQAPENAQNYNRYTYAFNNPLRYTDPSGYVAGDGGVSTRAGGTSGGIVGVDSRDYTPLILRQAQNGNTDALAYLLGRYGADFCNRHQCELANGLDGGGHAIGDMISDNGVLINAGIVNDYRSLEDELNARALGDGPIDLSQNELTTIYDYMVARARGLDENVPLTSGITGRSNAETSESQLETFDTILRPFGGRQLSIGGEFHEAGHVNYIGVGILLAHRGYDSLVSTAVVYWNVTQAFRRNGGDGIRNLRDIDPATVWALRGAEYYRQHGAGP